MSLDIVEKYGEAACPAIPAIRPRRVFLPPSAPAPMATGLTHIPAGEPVSLYLHIPFCRSMCWYCGCHTSITLKDEPILDYLDVLKREISIVAKTAGKPLKVRNIHFGGGTPTIMKPEEFLDLSAFMQKRLDVMPGVDIAVEIDPRNLDRRHDRRTRRSRRYPRKPRATELRTRVVAEGHQPHTDRGADGMGYG